MNNEPVGSYGVFHNRHNSSIPSLYPESFDGYSHDGYYDGSCDQYDNVSHDYDHITYDETDFESAPLIRHGSNDTSTI